MEDKYENKTQNTNVPSTTEEVTAEWLSEVLNADIQKNTLEVTGNVNSGLGFLSNLIRVKFSTNGQQHRKGNYIIKLLPHKTYIEERNLVIAEKMDKSEILFYQVLLPELVKEIPSLEQYICTFYYGKIQGEVPESNIEYASVLIMKDLKEDGFVAKPFSIGPLSEDEIELTIDFFTKFHAASILHEAKLGKTLPEVYDFFPKWYYPREIGSKQFVIHAWLDNSFEPIIKIISDYITKTHPKEKERGEELIANMLRPLAPHGQKIFDRVLEAGQQFPCAVHGDLWQNNVLTSSSNSPPAIKAIDWQLMGYSDPVYDLGVFLVSTGAENLTVSKYEHFVKLYFQKMEAIFAEKQKHGKIPGLQKRRSWEQLWATFKTYGIAYGFIFIMLSLETFTKHDGFLQKFYEALLFLHSEMKLSQFLIQLVAD